MDTQFTEKLQAWLNTPEDKRDYDEGNLLLLQLSNNKIRYANFSRNAKGKAQYIDYQLRKYLNFRLQKLTHEQVEDMQKKVDVINEKVGLDKDNSSFKKINEEFKAGKRADHDSLPEDIQALYVENLSILQRMRELHLRLRTLSIDDAPCPDSDRYPFLKELITLDKKMHDNWNQYDHAIAGQAAVDTEQAATTTEQTEDTTEQTEDTTEQSAVAAEQAKEVATEETAVANETVAEETATAPKKAKATKKTARKKKA